MERELSKKRRLMFRAVPFMIPSIIGLIIFALLPIVISFFISLTSWNGLDRLFSPTFMQDNYIGFQNYKEIFTTGELYRVLGNTMYYIVLYIPLMLVASLAVATLLNKGLKFTGVFRVIYYIPVLTSWVAGALVWKWFLSSQFGPVNEVLSWFGIKGPEWLTDVKWMIPSIVIASVWKDMGFFGLILLSGLQAISKTYYEAAEVDGASKTRQFFKITVPLLSPSIFFVMVISLINSFQIFPQVVVMIKDIRSIEAAQVMVERIYTYGFSYYKMGYASALSWVLFVIIFIFTILQMQLQKRWVHYEG